MENGDRNNKELGSSDIFNNPMAQQPIVGQCLPTNCWPYVYLSADRGELSSSQLWTASGLDRDYRCKSIVTQILHDAGLAPTSFIGRKFLSHGD